MKWQYDDGGVKKSKRPHTTKGCVVRAMAIVWQQPYDVFYEEVAILGRTCGRGSYDREFHPLLDQHAVRLPLFGAWSLASFQIAHDIGRYFVVRYGHAIALVDGVWHDVAQDRPDHVVTHAWRIEKPWTQPMREARTIKRLVNKYQ